MKDSEATSCNLVPAVIGSSAVGGCVVSEGCVSGEGYQADNAVCGKMVVVEQTVSADCAQHCHTLPLALHDLRPPSSSLCCSPNSWSHCCHVDAVVGCSEQHAQAAAVYDSGLARVALSLGCG